MAPADRSRHDAAEAKRERTGRPGASVKARVHAFDNGEVVRRSDAVATEEPLEIRLLQGAQTHTAAVTMRTPGNDFELAAGWLFAEGMVTDRSEVTKLAYCVDRGLGEEQQYNIVNVHLRADRPLDLRSLERHFFTTSACGVCGKAGIEQLQTSAKPVADGPQVDIDVIRSLPESLRAAQGIFERTGGLHAAGLFSTAGELVALREDVGRHNALDKLIGWALLDGRLPLADHIVLVSGRASFELVQKCVVAGVPVMCAVSAPSSLAIEVAVEFNLTLVGFLRDHRFNLYSAPERLSF
ncbi:MAG: formate dehydrogenase accessory sulfurtransferase FdhD [Actinomycetota bacterium]